jgi:hypothetical protein
MRLQKFNDAANLTKIVCNHFYCTCSVSCGTGVSVEKDVKAMKAILPALCSQNALICTG